MGNKTSYSEEFKKQIVMLYKNGKSVAIPYIVLLLFNNFFV
ncbi:hypothetical protein [Spiroplasma endosymbiont of Poecilobothrus nobilitatus]